MIRLSENDAVVTGVNGNHATGQTGDTVNAIDTRGHLTPRFFINLNKFFPNLETVLFEKGMTEIHKEELAQFPNMKRLYLSNNELQVIEADLFKNNKNLQLIFMDNCKIKSVASNVFDGLDSLTYLGFQNNQCYSGHVENDRGRTVELAENIYKNCGSSKTTIREYGSESCISKDEFFSFKTEIRKKFEEFTKKLDKLTEDTFSYVKIAKESCDSD